MSAGSTVAERGVEETAPARQRVTPSDRLQAIWPALLSYLAVAVPMAIGAVRILLDSRPFYQYGDQALIEIASRDASHGTQLLGPYSRFGYHHPGPALFYLYGAALRLIPENRRALYLAAVVLNALTAVAIIALVRRRAGAVAALWAAAVLSWVLLQGYTDVFRDIWNPDIIVLPMLLFVVLCADGAVGSAVSLIGAAAVGSFAVQTHLGTTPTVVALMALAIAVRLLSPRLLPKSPLGPGPPDGLPPSRSRGRPWALLGLAAVVALWVPTAIQQVRDNPGNVSSLVSFFTAGHPRQAIRSSVQLLGRAFEAPFTHYRSILPLAPHRNYAPAVAVLVVWTAVVCLIAWRRRTRWALALAGLALAGEAVTLVSLIDVAGPLEPYLAIWMSGLVATAGLATGLLFWEIPSAATARQPDGRRARSIVVLAVAALVAVNGVALTERALTGTDIPLANRGEVQRVWALVAPRLGPPAQPVLVLDEPGTETTEPGVVLELLRSGRPPRVDPSERYLYGSRYVGTGTEPTQIAIYRADNPLATGQGVPGFQRLGTTDGMTVFLMRRGS